MGRKRQRTGLRRATKQPPQLNLWGLFSFWPLAIYYIPAT
nr:MAG TPA: hypothetical protein [Caudoviricetes sp.]